MVGISVKSPQFPLMARPRCTIVRANPMRISIAMTLNWLQLRAMENGTCLSLAPSNGVTKLSAAHKVKGFADDISVFSSSASDHAVVLRTIDNHCSDLDLTLKPAKCISLVFNGKKVLTTTFPLGNGHTRSINSGHTRFLGCTLGCNNSVTSRVCRKKIVEAFREKISNLDSSSI